MLFTLKTMQRLQRSVLGQICSISILVVLGTLLVGRGNTVNAQDIEGLVDSRDCEAGAGTGIFNNLTVEGCTGSNCIVDLYESYEFNLTFTPKSNHSWYNVFTGVSNNRSYDVFLFGSINMSAGSPYSVNWAFGFDSTFAADPTDQVHTVTLYVGGNHTVAESCRTFDVRLNTNVTGEGKNTGTQTGEGCMVPGISCSFLNSLCLPNGESLRCGCDATSIAERRKCKRKIYQPCTVKDECLLDAICEGGTCQCKAGFKPVPTNDKCETGSGTIVALSVLALVLQQFFVYFT